MKNEIRLRFSLNLYKDALKVTLMALGMITIVQGLFQEVWSLELDTNQAQVEAPQRLAMTRVQGMKRNTHENEVARSATRISGQEIQERNISNLRDLLITLPGVQIQDDPALLTSNVVINGVSGENIRIYIDGVPVIGLVSGQLDVSQIPLQDVVEVKVIETPLSVEFGSQAVGGVIAITTKSSQASRGVELSAGLGLESVQRYSQNASVKLGNLNHSLGFNFSHIQQEEFNQSSGRRPMWAPTEIFQWGSVYSWSSDHWTNRLQYQGTQDDKVLKGDWLPDASSLAFDPVVGEFLAQDSTAKDVSYLTQRHSLSNFTQWTLDRDQVFEWVNSGAHYERISQNHHTTWADGVDSAGVATPNVYESMNSSLLYKNSKQEKMPFLLGAEAEHYSTEGERIKDHYQELQRGAIFANTSIKHADPITLELGIRAQFNSDYQVKTWGPTPLIPSLGVTFAHGDEGMTSLGYSRGFRSPSLQELYFNFHDGGSHSIDGNPDLQAETSHNYYANITQCWRPEGLNITQKFSSYYHEIDQKIIIAERSDQLGTHLYQNVGDYTSVGGSLMHQVNHQSGLSAKTTLGYHGVSALEDSRAIPSLYLFRKELLGELSYEYAKWGTSLTYRHFYHGSTIHYMIEEGELEQGRVSDWDQVDIFLNQGLDFGSHRMQISTGVKNLLDVQDLSAFGDIGGGGHSSPGPVSVARGQIWYANLQYNFK